MKSFLTIGLLLVAVLGFGGCRAPDRPPAAEGEAGAAVDPDSRAPGIEALGSTDWVTIYDPEKASSGYTLAFHKRRVPILIDMNGRVVHSWPEARSKSRLRLLRDGHLLVIALGRAVAEYDWAGNLVWDYRTEEEMPHHDVVRLANGNTMMVLRSRTRTTDDLLEVDREGQVVRRWRSADHLTPWFPDSVRTRGDVTHINAVQELPENPWFEAGDERFRPGNLLVSPRNLNAIFIIDRQSGEVVWSYDHQLDMQHEALMIEPGLPNHGRILIFSNGYRNRFAYRKSTILEIDPVSAEVTWSYRNDDFYSATGGIEQPLANGNVLISSSRGGRVFEITREGEIVWQWVPPFDPNRPRRVAFDHSPQLAAMERPVAIPVSPPAGYRHVDPAVYQFARRGARAMVNVNGQKRSIMIDNNACRELMLPMDATLEVTYGLNRQAINQDRRRDFAASFGVSLRPLDSRDEVELLSDTVTLDSQFRRRRQLEIAEYALRWVELCLSTATASGDADPRLDDYVYWLDPRIRRGGRPDAPSTEAALEGLTAEELEVREEHLRALGYID